MSAQLQPGEWANLRCDVCDETFTGFHKLNAAGDRCCPKCFAAPSTAQARREYRHATLAYAIRVPCGLYFGGFRDQRKDPVTPVKWVSGLCEARLFGGNCYAQAEKYVERIKAKDPLYVGLKVVTVELLPF